MTKVIRQFLIIVLFFSGVIASGCLQFSMDSDTIVWMHTYLFGYKSYGYNVIRIADGHYVSVGSSVPEYGETNAVFLLKVDKYGDVIWSRQIGSSCFGRDIIHTSDDCYAICGRQMVDSQGEDIMLVTTDANSEPIVTRTYGGALDEDAGKILETDDHSFLLLGSTYSFGSGNSDIYLIKVDKSGDLIWQKTYGGTDFDMGADIVELEDGYLIGGTTRSYGQGNDDFYLIKITSSGEVVWSRTHGGPEADSLSAVLYLPGDGFLLLGDIERNSSNREVSLVRTDMDGNELWSKTYGSNEINDSYDMTRSARCRSLNFKFVFMTTAYLSF